MRIARISYEDELRYGVVEGVDDAGDPLDGAAIALLAGHPFGEVAPTDVVLPLAEVRLVAPVLPTKVIAVAKNYVAHAVEMGSQAPTEPVVFLKPSTAVIGPGEAIALPWQSEKVEHEAELAVVIGRYCRDVAAERAADVILGYTCANDVTARDLQKTDGQWGRAKGFDTFCPLGPWIQTDLEADDVMITCRVNGDLRQEGNSGDMVHGIPDLVAWISSVMTLLPGDVILTGTPAGVGPLRAGERVEVSIEGIGTLANPVVDRG